MLVGAPLLVVSGCVLALEVLLTRLLSISQWHHSAYMIISTALLGFGASGTLAALVRKFIRRHFRLVATTSTFLFAVATVVCFALAQKVPFNVLDLVWQPEQIAFLAEIYVLLAIPFFFAAFFICAVFVRFSNDANRLYGINLVGSGAGALGCVAALYVLSPQHVLVTVSGLGFLSTVMLGYGAAGRFFVPLSLASCALLAQFAFRTDVAPRIPEDKMLSVLQHLPEAELVYEGHSPLGYVAVVAGPTLHHFFGATGQSFSYDREVPPQMVIITDADSTSAITTFSDIEDVAFLDHTTAAVAYHLRPRRSVLVIGAGGGSDVLLALYHDAAHVTAVELNPQVVDIVRRVVGDFARHIYDDPRVEVVVGEGRGYVRSHAPPPQGFDLVQIALLDTFTSSSAGVHALDESYLYTVQALGDFLAQLGPEGVLSITRWKKTPPRDGIKLFATALEAARRLDPAHPAMHLAFIRSWATTTVLVKKTHLSSAEVQAVRDFCRDRGFDLAYLPGMAPQDANRRHVLEHPHYYEAARALVDDAEGFYKRYPLDVRPATDDRPYFSNFFRWHNVPYLLSRRGRGQIPFLEWGFLLLLLTLAQASCVGAVLVVVPLVLARKGLAGGGKGFTLIYFLCIGAAYLLLEMAFIQKMMLFLAHPVYAVAVVLAAFLAFSGLGSMLSEKICPPLGRRVALAVCAIVALVVAYRLCLERVFDLLSHLGDPAKIAVSLAIVAPLAFFMGMPFPAGLGRLAAANPKLIPWAWAVNGFASVTSAVLGTMLAMTFGFRAVTYTAAAIYVAAALSQRLLPLGEDNTAQA